MSHESSLPEKSVESGRLPGTPAQFETRQEESGGLRSRSWHLALAGALAAALLWYLIMPHYPFFVYIHQGTMYAPDPGETETVARYRYMNPPLLFAAITSSCALAFAAAEGLARRSIKFVALGTAASILVSGSIGAAAGWLAQWVFDLPLYRLIDLAKGVVVQATCWSVVGLGIGIGLALPAWRGRAIGFAAAGALAGGLLAALTYQPLSAVIVQMADTDALVPHESLQRLIWLSTATVLMGCIAGGLAGPRRTSTVPPVSPPPV